MSENSRLLGLDRQVCTKVANAVDFSQDGVMSMLTTHVLDTTHGRPAYGMGVRLLKEGEVLASAVTNVDGRCDGPLLEGEALVPGIYELQFQVWEYFAGLGVKSPFLEVVPVRFRVEEGRSYHVPLVVSPYAYSTYRGS